MNRPAANSAPIPRNQPVPQYVPVRAPVVPPAAPPILPPNPPPFNPAFNPQPTAPPYVYIPPIPPIPQNDDKLKELREKLAGIENDNKKLEEKIKNALILENPRLLQAFYPIGRPIYDHKTLLDAALEHQIEKNIREAQTIGKLRDIYGPDAAAVYLNRALGRLENKYEPPKFAEEQPRPQQRSRSKSTTRNKNRTKKSAKKSPAKKKSNKK